ncbi:oxidative damage protection protein [Pseudomaricurvus alkylphenolicus]|jgi:Fe-S cluster biosynthesis and repair protein YggX|uniref:oxidative damage protection protein n=1 Tax=Pseudomaricurvus alkylphenolicus TaxID=1306991 RepID=UPI00141F7BAD|nr:oxidative damage protection protein [Pseudomaricurvus alkylphenolicus]NIB39582.1 oxidative damage protection protein [Pseudomaricurvus alkylphenolicus]
MTRTVFCRKYQQELPGLQAPPYPGAKGQELFDTISQKAWNDWMHHQTMLINEKHLNMMDMTARTYLSEQMEKFFSGGDYDAAEGYVPPSQDG